MTDGAADYPRELEGTIRLRRDLDLVVRPLQPTEGGWVRELHRGLSARTQYLRFFSVMPTLPDSLVALLTAVDYRQRLALIVERRTPAAPEPIALASYSMIEGDGAAEVGIVVQDAWQARGIGSVLARRLLAAARARGFERFAAHVLLENVVARRFIRRVGHVVSTRLRGGVAEVLFVPVERAGQFLQ